MKIITKEQAIPGVWNFIDRGEFPGPDEKVLMTYSSLSDHVALAYFNSGEDWFFQAIDGRTFSENVISWQYPPAPSKRTHKEQWMSQWVDDGSWHTHPSGYEYCYPGDLSQPVPLWRNGTPWTHLYDRSQDMKEIAYNDFMQQ